MGRGRKALRCLALGTGFAGGPIPLGNGQKKVSLVCENEISNFIAEASLVDKGLLYKVGESEKQVSLESDRREVAGR